MIRGQNSEMVAIETIAAESEKFTSPLLFVHGLWSTAAVWRQFMGYCAHRGWTCHALNLPGRGDHHDVDRDPELRLPDFVVAVATAAAAFETRPVLIGHDLGGLLVLANAASARAVVSLAPLLADSLEVVTRSLLGGWRIKLAAWQSRPLAPSQGRLCDDYLRGADQLGLLVPEPSRFLRELGRQARALNLGSAVPTLLVGAEHDRFAPPEQLQRLAHQLGAEFALAPGAIHAIPWDRGWDRTVATVHRWLVQRLGEELLVPPEDEAED